MTNSNNFEVYFDCGTSKIRACAFNKKDQKNNFHYESSFFSNHLNIKSEIQKIISAMERDSREYLNDINLMIDSSKMLSIGISISKKLDGLKLQKEDIQFLILDAKQQILRNYHDQNITHIIIKKYKIDNIEYTFLPENINCNLISLDIIFICLPKEKIEYFKKIFFELDVSVAQIFCTSYAKSINYKDNYSMIDNVIFVDVGFNKTSINCFINNQVVFLDAILVGGNHITKDISKVLKIDLQESENLKILFAKKQKIPNKEKSPDHLTQEIILARIEEILELCLKSIKLNLNLVTLDKCKVILIGEGSKIFNYRFKKKNYFLKNIEIFEETPEEICQSAFKLVKGLNKQEVVIIPKKQLKKGFFERLFLFFM
jgi:cell division protein FtsA